MVVAALLAASLSVLMALVEPAKAAFPGTNDKISFYSDRTGNNEVFHMNPDNTRQTNLTSSSAADYGHAYSPDGTKIAFFSTRHGYAEIYTMTSAGLSQTRLTFNAANDVRPSWQPV